MAKQNPSKGTQTRGRILRSAIRLFGDRGFDRVTTREIAAAAGVHQPVIAHYFGDKLSLYEACAKTVVDRYLEHLRASGDLARADLDAGCSIETARSHLARLSLDFAEFMATEDPESTFIIREMTQGGHTFDLFYDTVLGPGLELFAELISRVHPDGADMKQARVEALMLASSLAAFEIGRPLLGRFLGQGRALAKKQRDATVRANIERLYGRPN